METAEDDAQAVIGEFDRTEELTKERLEGVLLSLRPSPGR